VDSLPTAASSLLELGDLAASRPQNTAAACSALTETDVERSVNTTSSPASDARSAEDEELQPRVIVSIIDEDNDDAMSDEDSVDDVPDLSVPDAQLVADCAVASSSSSKTNSSSTTTVPTGTRVRKLKASNTTRFNSQNLLLTQFLKLRATISSYLSYCRQGGLSTNVLQRKDWILMREIVTGSYGSPLSHLPLGSVH
jgi:hypothetical protein